MGTVSQEEVIRELLVTALIILLHDAKVAGGHHYIKSEKRRVRVVISLNRDTQARNVLHNGSQPSSLDLLNRDNLLGRVL